MELIEIVRSEHKKLMDICSLNDLSLFGYPEIKQSAIVDLTKIGKFLRSDRFKQVKICRMVIDSEFTSTYNNFVLIKVLIAISLDKNRERYNQAQLLQFRYNLTENKFDLITF